MFNEYPYININDLNLDFILRAIKEMRNEVTNFVSINAIKYADPIQWSIIRQYEKNTIVIDPVSGTAYISVAPVPAGVALTRPEYWTVVFDLQSFVTKANQNLANNYEEQTTTTATMNTTAGDWVIWGDVLYKALVNITAGDAYVVGSNIERITIENVVNTILTAISDEAQARTDADNDIIAAMGDLDDLTTTDKSSVVNAINETVQEIDDINTTMGDLDDLTTTDKSSVVNAINETVQEIDDINTTIGDLNDLTTPVKDSIVNAINSKESFKVATNPQYVIFVDGVNGDDTNDGLTAATAVKTLDCATDFFNKYSSALRFEILTAGTYTLTKTVFSGVFFHIKPHVQGIILQTDPSNDITFYNSDVLFLDDVANLGTWITWQGHRILTVNSHFELYNVDFQIGFHLEGTNGQFTRCTFERNCLFTDSYGLIVNCTNNTDSNSNYTITFQHNSRAELRGVMYYGANYNQQYYQFFIYDSIVTNLIDFSTDTATHTFRLERSTLYTLYAQLPKFIKVGASDIVINDTNNPTLSDPLPAGVSDLTLATLQIGNGHYSVQGRVVIASDITSNTLIATLPIPPAQNTWIIMVNQNGTGYLYIDTAGRVYIARCVAGTTYFNGVVKSVLNSVN